MTAQGAQLFLADLAIVIPLSRPLGMGDAHLAVGEPAAFADVVWRLPGGDTWCKVMPLGTPRTGRPNGRAGQAKAGRSGPGR